MRRFVLSASLTTLALACSSAPTYESADALAACEHAFDARAKRDDSCHGELAPSSGLPLQRGPDNRFAPETREGMVKVCVARTKAPGSGFTAARVEACAAELARGSCFDDEPETCRFHAGSLADGAPCAFWDQCASGRCKQHASAGGDAGAAPSYCGVCEPTAQAGESCDDEAGPPCRDGLECVAGRCTPVDEAPRPRGALCQSGGSLSSCAIGNYCDIAIRGGEIVGTCTKVPALGEACNEWCEKGSVCAGGKCVAEVGPGGACPLGSECALALRCNAGTCEPYAVVPVGGVCGAKAPGTVCATGAACVLEAGSPGIQKCVARIAEGGACATGPSAPPCAHGRQCTNGTCAVVDATTCK